MTYHVVTTQAECDTAEIFWLRYLHAHHHPVTRNIHYIGVGVGVVSLVASIMTASWALFWLGLLTGYVTALTGHLVGGHTDFLCVDGQPLRSLLCCCRMSFCALIGEIEGEFRRAEASPLFQEHRVPG